MPRRKYRLAPEDMPNPVYAGETLWGRRALIDVRSMVTNSDVRKHGQDEEYLIHRPKNGIYDPITYYHVVDYLANVRRDVAFRSSHLVAALRIHKPQFVWDATTVGRIMNDLAETLNEVYDPVQVIRVQQTFDGRIYVVSAHTIAHVALVRLVKDLRDNARKVVAAELAGTAVKRVQSPLNNCPSVIV